jgi:hypothetical protein
MLLILVVAFLGLQSCRPSADNSQALTPARRIAVEDSVRRFAAAVAHDVTQEGPMAWQKYFADSPDFFMAVNGQIAFPNGQAAAHAIPEIARLFKHIELRWGDDLRLDVLTENLCDVAVSYTEVIDPQPAAESMRGTHNGYFTGLVENRNGQWQFRNAHWSESVPPIQAPPANAP